MEPLSLWSQKVVIHPFPLMLLFPRQTHLSLPQLTPGPFVTSSAATRDMWTEFGSEVLSMRLAVFTVSPNKQNRGFMVPITEATTGPEWKPTRMLTHPISGEVKLMGVFLAMLISCITEKRPDTQ